MDTATTQQMHAENGSHIAQTIKNYGKQLLGFIRKRVKSDEDAEDILQDVWLQLTSTLNTSPVEQTGAWLYRVTRNRIIDKYRKHTEENLISEFEVEADDDEVNFKELLLVETDTPETEYLRTLFWEQLFIALEELPFDQRQVFTLHELDGKSFNEIAQLTGENVKTLLSRKRYAVLHLRNRLQQLYHEIIEF